MNKKQTRNKKSIREQWEYVKQPNVLVRVSKGDKAQKNYTKKQ